METWTYMGDLPYPVSPGSYRYGTRAISPDRKKKRVRLVYIKSGVRTPLLSDLEAKSTIRFGLDVVNDRAVPSNTPTTVLEDFEAPPPTANTIVGRRNHANYTKDVVYVDQTSAKVDFTKLHPYKWMSTPNKTIPPVAPDYMYQNTYISGTPESIVRMPSPEFKAKRGLLMYADTTNKRPQTVPDESQSSVAIEKPRRPKSKSVTFITQTPKQSVHLHQLKTPPVYKKNENLQKLELNVRSIDQRNKLAGPNGCLHSQVNNSIKFIKKVDRGDILDLPQLPRPMHSEKGRYRPHSKTRLESPQLAIPPGDAADKNKDFKSADVFLQLVKKSKSTMSGKSNSRSYSSMATPGMNEILAKYMNGGHYDETPRTKAASVDVPSHINPPVSRCSTRHSAIKIPEWAEEERARNTEEVGINIPQVQLS